MEPYFGCVLTLCVFLVNYGWVEGATNCEPFSSQSLMTVHCSSHDRNTAVYKDMDTALKDAIQQEHVASFVIDTVVQMYMYLHPCLTTAEAILELFYEHAPDPDDAWIQSANQQLGSAPMIGRRRRDVHYGSENALLTSELDELRQRADVSCIQLFINNYTGYAQQQWIRMNPGFRLPTTHLPATTPTTTPTTTTQLPTTPWPTSPQTTTLPPPTSIETTVPETSTLGQPVTYGPIKCTTCSGLGCLISPTVTDCPAGQFFCMTTVQDSSSGRDIIRGCADQATCDEQYLGQTLHNSDCADVDHNIVHHDNACHFCCLGDNCNHPPQVTPNADTLYSKP